MPEVQAYTVDGVDALIAGAVVSANIDTGTGHLTLTTHDGTVIDVGSVVTGISDASTSAKGVVELATDVETQAGTDGNRAVTPLGLSALASTTSAKGLVELATDAETTTGTDAVRAVTPHGLAAVITALALATTYQAKDSDLTTIAGLTPGTTDFLQAVAGVWSNRTPTQVAATLATVGLPVSSYSTGSGYSAVNGAAIYVGPTDPGSVANGSIWLDTTGT